MNYGPTYRRAIPTLALAAPILLIASIQSTTAGTLTVRANVAAPNPDILAYNLGHFAENSNTHDWWRYAGVNGARVFISPGTVEANDDIPGFGDGVTDPVSFLTRRAALRGDPLNTTYINWPYFEDRYETKLFGNSSSGNRFTVNYAFGKLRELEIHILAQITGSENNLPIADDSDWAGKWEYWQHYYAQAFYLGRHFDVMRYQMYNEPNHPNANGLTPANWLMRLQLASDAVQSALADVNALYGKSLEPLIYAPVNSGGNQYNGWGDLAVQNRHINFLGVFDPAFLVMHRYDYHQYNSTASSFGSTLNAIKSAVAADMAPETRFPMSISEFNVHTGATFDGLTETLDDPEKYTRLGAIGVQLAKNFEKEFYCFKFGQTLRGGGTYPVSKNGMHYVQNGEAPYDYGGATLAAEVWRLFVKALAPGGQQLDYDRDPDGSLDDLDLRATYRPDTGNYYVYSANESSGATMTIDTSDWNIPAGSRFLLEEVSPNRYGSGRTWSTVSADGTLFDGTDNLLFQPADTVWLFTIPGAALQAETILDAHQDATVTDGSHAGTNDGAASNLLARNDPATANNRSAAFMQFKLPIIYPPDIQLAVLSLRGRTGTASATVQAHVYGLDADGWSADTLTWANAPNLRTGASAGNLIADRVITGQGDSAFLQGQVAVTSTSYSTKMIEVTRFLQGQPNRDVSFLVSQDPRWDVALPSLAAGDTQVDGLEFVSSEAATPSNPGPQLKWVRLKDDDGDGLSNEAETTIFFTNPALPDTDDDGQTDGQEWFAGSDPTNDLSRFTLPVAKLVGDDSIRMQWPSLEHRTYRIERSASLQPFQWSTVHTAAGTGNTLNHTDTPGTTNAYYRLTVE